MECIELFSLPIYKFKFEGHTKNVSRALQYLTDGDNYKDFTSRKTLMFTSPDLHKIDQFKPYHEFFKTSLEHVMEDLGFEPRIELTGMWATLHSQQGFHHRHTHGNSFLAGVFYLSGNETCSGTTFYNDRNEHNIIIPKRLKDKPRKIKNHFTTTFEEGVLYIFPAWLSHNTSHNTAGINRMILSFNAMPVGPTNQDPFDRYNYQSVDGVELVQSRQDIIT